MPAATSLPPVPSVPALLSPAPAAPAGPALCEVATAPPPSAAARVLTFGCWLLAALSVCGGALALGSAPSSGGAGGMPAHAETALRPR